MPTRAEIVDIARSWLGVRYRHQGHSRHGVDCAGLVGAVAVQAGVVPADWWEAHLDPALAGYGRSPTGDSLLLACTRYMQRTGAPPRPGDVVLLRFASDPTHLGIVADYRHGGLSLVHSMRTVGQVAEHRLAPPWRARIVDTFAYPGVA